MSATSRGRYQTPGRWFVSSPRLGYSLFSWGGISTIVKHDDRTYLFFDGLSAPESESEPDRLSRLLWSLDRERCRRRPLDDDWVASSCRVLDGDRERWWRGMKLRVGRGGPRISVRMEGPHLSSHRHRITPKMCHHHHPRDLHPNLCHPQIQNSWGLVRWCQ